MFKDIYLPGDRYDRLIDALANAPECPFSSPDARRAWIRDQVIIALGKVDIWPVEIFGDLVVDAVEHAEKQRALIAAGMIADPARLS